MNGLSPELRAAILAAYRAWRMRQQQLALFDDAEMIA